MQASAQQVAADVSRALAEDLGDGDVSRDLLPEDQEGTAEIISREAMVVAGIPWANAVFQSINPKIHVEWLVEEGAFLKKPQTLCLISGSVRDILTAERTALNFLQTLSATALQTYRYGQAILGTGAVILDTRKTLPGLRYAQKYAVSCGGGQNHRMGLYDAFLIKENHIMACGSIKEAILRARSLDKDKFLEVEVETLAELQEALVLQPDRILLDNFSVAAIKQAVALNRPHRVDLEVSGGVNLANVREIAELGVEYISVGAITKSIAAIDLSLLLRP